MSDNTNKKREFSTESRAFRALEKEDKYNKVLEFCKTHNRAPKVSNKSTEEERVLGQFLINSKSTINRGSANQWEVELVNKINTFCPKRESRLNKINTLVAFCKEHNRTPRQSSNNITEKRLGQFFNTIKNLQKINRLNEEEIAAFAKIIPYRTNSQRTRDEKLNDVLEFCKDRNRTPKQHVSDKTEKRMAEFLTTAKILYRTNKLNETCNNLMREIMKYAPLTRKEKLIKLLDFAKVNMRSPKMNSDDIDERKLAVFLTKINALHRNNNLNESEVAFVNDIRKLCDIKTRKQKLEGLLNYIVTNKRLPRLNSDDYDERKLAMFYNNTNQSVKKNKLNSDELDIFNQCRMRSQKDSHVG